LKKNKCDSKYSKSTTGTSESFLNFLNDQKHNNFNLKSNLFLVNDIYVGLSAYEGILL